MPSRRNFIKSTVGLSVLPLVGHAMPLAAPGGEPYTMPFRMVFDTSLPAGRAFGEEAAARGGAVIGDTGDWTRVWLKEIDAQWRREPVAVAGLTPHGPMFMFEQLARRHGMRLVFSAELVRRPAGEAGLTARGWPTLLSEVPTTIEDEIDWARRMAAHLTRIPYAQTPLQLATMQVGRVRPSPADDPVYAWAIAPVAGAARFA